MVLKCALNNICNTVLLLSLLFSSLYCLLYIYIYIYISNKVGISLSGQGPSSSGGQLRSARKKPGRGICLTSQSKHILTSVSSYFEEEK